MLISKTNIPEILQNEEICITGYSGYVGTQMVRALVENGIRPYLIGRQGVNPKKLYGCESFDRWDTPESLGASLKRLKNPVILNIAGYFISKHEADDIENLIAGNLHFAINIFEALKISKHKRIVNIGTSWEYSGTGEHLPANLYAHLKAANSRILDWYSKEYSLKAINIKLNDTYGKEDNRSKLMPLLKQNWQAGTTMHLRASSQMINLLHIVDVLEGLLKAAQITEHMSHGTCQTYFLKARETVSIEELISLINKNVSKEIDVTYEDVGVKSASLKTVWDKAPQPPSWSPRIDLAQGIKEYFTQNVNRKK
jgi:nucleoside-diphosphate-sugar epimerase